MSDVFNEHPLMFWHGRKSTSIDDWDKYEL